MWRLCLCLQSVRIVKENEMIKEQFLKHIKLIKDVTTHWQDRLILSKKYNLTMPVDDNFEGQLQDALIKAIETAMNDKDNYVSWWIYETDFGKKHTKIYEKDVVLADLKTAEDLYDWLKKERAGQR